MKSLLLGLCLLPATCSLSQRQQDAKAVKAFLDSTDVNVGASYDGVTATVGRVNGRKTLGVGVNAAELQRDIDAQP